METESNPDEQPSMHLMRTAELRLSDWIWRPWYAKLWWAAIPIYWGGRLVSLKIPTLAELYDSLIGVCLAAAFNPLVTAILLGFGYVRAKLDRGDWVMTPDMPATRLRPGEMSDPYTDPTDPRSGVRYLEHMGLHDRRPH